MIRPALLLVGVLGCKSGGVDTSPSTTPTTGTGVSAGVLPGTVGGSPSTGSTGTGLVGSSVLQFEGKVPKNLIFVSVDTFRKDHVGVHGTKGLTPWLDQIAADGVVMNQHHQCSNWTFGSTTCTLAGRSNIERGHLPRLNGTNETRPAVPAGTPFLATWLGDNDFFTQIVSGNDWLSANWGNTQGYLSEAKPFGNATAVLSKSLELLQPQLDNQAFGRWFMHMHTMEPHASYEPDPALIVGLELLEPWPDDLTVRTTHYGWRDAWPGLDADTQVLLEAHLRVLYEAEVRTWDARMAANWQQLDDDGLLDDTLVVFWNDHGEQFWEHGNQTHAYNLYGDENDGFLIFWSKNIVPGAWDEPTASIDLVPTLLDLYGIPIPQEVTGLPIGSAPADRPIFSEALARSGGVQTVVKEGWKLHYNWADGSVKVFNRNVDPDELNDLYDAQDPMTLDLWSLLRPQVDAMAGLVVGGVPAPLYPPDLP